MSRPPAKPFLDWVDRRFPLSELYNRHLKQYYAPKNLNFWYIFGSLALTVLAIQLVTGIFLAMHYKPDAARSFASVEYIMRDVPWGWLIRFLGVLVRLALIGLVVGHVMALHQVGSNNPDGIDIEANKDAQGIPLDGIPFQLYYTVHEIFAVSVFLVVFFAVVFFAPEVGGYFLEATNFIEADPLKTPPHIAPVWYFTPFYSMLRATTDLMVDVFCLIVALLGVVVVSRRGVGKGAKILAAAALLGTILLLRTFDAKFWGVVVMGASVLVPFFLPWLDRSPVRSIRYRPGWHKILYAVFVTAFLILGYLGTRPPTPGGTYAAQALTIVYFAFFLSMPVWSRRGSFRPVPDRVSFTPHP